MSRPARAATSRMRACGPTRIGSIRPQPRRFDRALQRDIVAGMRDGDLDRRLWLCAALIRRSYLSCGRAAALIAVSGMRRLRLGSLRRSTPNSASTRVRRRLPSSDRSPRAARTRCRTSSAALRAASSSPSSFGMARDRALLVEADEQVLLPQHLLEPRQAHALGGRARRADQPAARRSHAHRRCLPAGGHRSARAARPLPVRPTSKRCSSSDAQPRLVAPR